MKPAPARFVVKVSAPSKTRRQQRRPTERKDTSEKRARKRLEPPFARRDLAWNLVDPNRVVDGLRSNDRIRNCAERVNGKRAQRTPRLTPSQPPTTVSGTLMPNPARHKCALVRN